MPLGAALTARHASDAHMVGYAATWEGKPLRWRLAGRHAGDPKLSIAMRWAIFDLDGPGHQAPAAWRAAQLAIIAGHEQLARAVVYQTRGGMRLVCALAEPFAIGGDADAQRWRACYLGACDWLQSLGLAPDRSCVDWTRLFRLPLVVRDGEQTESTLTGDPQTIGCLDLERFGGASLSGMRSQSPRGTDPARADAAPHGGCNAMPQSDRPAGALHAALLARGDVVRQISPGMLAVRCPNRARHSCGVDGDGSTILILPETLSGSGLLHCKHNACADLTDADQWLGLLGVCPPAVRTVRATVTRAYPNGDHVRLELDADGDSLSVRLRPPPRGSAARWTAVWDACGVKAPTDLDPFGAQGDACAELRGRGVAIELDGARVARFHAALET